LPHLVEDLSLRILRIAAEKGRDSWITVHFSSIPCIVLSLAK